MSPPVRRHETVWLALRGNADSGVADSEVKHRTLIGGITGGLIAGVASRVLADVAGWVIAGVASGLEVDAHHHFALPGELDRSPTSVISNTWRTRQPVASRRQTARPWPKLKG